MTANELVPPRGIGPIDSPRSSAGRSQQTLRERAASIPFLGPNLILYILFLVVPAVSGVVLSFFQWGLFDDPVWVGLEQYQRLVTDNQVLPVLGVTAAFLVLGVIPTVLISFLLAVLVNWNAPGVATIRVLYLLPLVISTAVAGLLWSRLFDVQNGIINNILSAVGIPRIAWLGSADTALIALTIVVIWLSIPIPIILYLAGLQRIPTHVHEAAALDGAGAWRRIWGIAWPMMAPTTALVVGLEVLQFLSAPFEVSLIMTGGGPLNSTTPLSLYAYQQAFEQLDVGYASALSSLQFVSILVVVGIVLLISRVARKS